MDEITTHESPAGHIDRREALRRGAFVVGAATLWATPVVQTLGMRPAAAQSPAGHFCSDDSVTPEWLVFRYEHGNGMGHTVDIKVTRGKATPGQNANTAYLCGVGSGETILLDKDPLLGGKLNPEITLKATDGNTTQTVTIHTSCSVPLKIGDRFGRFVLVAGRDDAGNIEPAGYSPSGDHLLESACATSLFADEEVEKAEKEKGAAEKAEQEKAEQQKAAEEKAEKAEQQKAAEEKAEKAEQQKAAEEKAEKAEQQKAAEEKAEKEKAAEEGE